MKTMGTHRRRTVLLAAGGVLCATFPTLALMPLRQARVLSDPSYFMGVGFCLGLAVVMLVLAFQALLQSKRAPVLREE